MSAPILERIRTAENLPSLPTVALNILRLTRDPDSNAEDIAKVLGTDPALAAKILKMVNSSLFGVVREVTSIKKAVALLGMRTVKVLALSFSLVELIRGEAGRSVTFDYENFWRHSLTSAVAGRLLADATMSQLKEDAFVGGLLSDLGVLAATSCAPELYEPVLESWKELGKWDTEAERRIVGVSHAMISRELLSRWGLPDLLCNSIGAHHGEGYDSLIGTTHKLAAILRGAASITELFCGDVPVTDIDRCKQTCRELIGIDDDALDRVLDGVGEHLQEIASLLSVRIGQTTSYQELQIEAAEELAKLSVEAEVERSASVREAEKSRMRADQLQEEKKEILEIASTDGLTRIANRASFDKRLEEEVSRALAAHEPLGLIMVDVDDFKSFNDNFGHRAGDEVLRSVAGCLEQVSKGIGNAYRYGGEEFTILLTREATMRIRELVESIRRAITSSRIDHEGTRMQVTVSVGAVCLQPDRDELSPEQLVEQADRCLYKAKRAGRNRAVIRQ